MLMLTFQKNRTKLFCCGNPHSPKQNKTALLWESHSQKQNKFLLLCEFLFPKTEQNCSIMGIPIPKKQNKIDLLREFPFPKTTKLSRFWQM